MRKITVNYYYRVPAPYVLFEFVYEYENELALVVEYILFSDDNLEFKSDDIDEIKRLLGIPCHMTITTYYLESYHLFQAELHETSELIRGQFYNFELKFIIRRNVSDLMNHFSYLTLAFWCIQK